MQPEQCSNHKRAGTDINAHKHVAAWFTTSKVYREVLRPQRQVVPPNLHVKLKHTVLKHFKIKHLAF